MRVDRTVWLRILGCAALLLGFTPLLALCTALAGHAPAANLSRIGWLLATGLAGFGLHRLLQVKTSFSLFLRALCLIGSSLLFGAASLLFAAGIGERAALGLLFAAGHLWGARFARRTFSELLPDHTFWKMLALYGAFLILPYAASHFFPLVYSQLLNAISFLCFAALYLLLHNQANIDGLTASRHYSLEFLPKRIRIYNIALVAAIVLLVGGLFAALYLSMPDLSEWLERFKQWLIGILSSGPLPEEAAEQPMQDMGGVQDLLPELGEDEGRLEWLGSLLKFLFGGILIGGVAAVLIYNRTSIAIALRQLWQRLRGLIAGLFRRASALPRREETADYTDYDQAVAMETTRETGVCGRQRQWKRAVRSYQKMADSSEKYRAGYGLAVTGLALCGTGVRDADTPLEIAGKASGLLQEQSCAAATDFYDLLQYGERAYRPGSTELIDRLLAELDAQRKKGKR